MQVGRSDCEGAKNGEFKNWGGRVYVFGKRIKECINSIASGLM